MASSIRGYKSLIKEVTGDKCSGLVSLRMKGALTGESFANSRTLTLGGAVPLDQQGPRCQSIRYKN